MGALGRREILFGLAAAAAGAALPRPANAATQTLRGLADAKGLSFGSAIDPELLDKPGYSQLILDQCNTIVPRNALKWDATERSAGGFQFGSADRAVAFAQGNKLAVRGTTLIWYRSPGWVTSLNDPKRLTDAMTTHISTVVGRYAGKIASWDVVNEPFEYPSAEMRKSVFFKVLGEQHIDVAFNAARAADPKCQLVLNETHLSLAGEAFDAKRKAVLALLDRLQTRKVPIDGLGVQGHIRPGLDKIDPNAFAAFCKELKSRGLALLLTELDSSCRFVKRLPDFKPADYGASFSDQISIAEVNAKLTAVIVWGLSPFGLKPNEPSSPDTTCKYRVNLFDDKLQPLPTFDAVESALSGKGV